jgi:FkbM family methyltransferase
MLAKAGKDFRTQTWYIPSHSTGIQKHEKMRKLLSLIYKLGLRQPWQRIDHLHYLKRLQRKKRRNDEWFYSEKDAYQYSGTEVLVCGQFRGVNVLLSLSPNSHTERQIIPQGIANIGFFSLMSRFVSPGTIVVDVGAHIGTYAVPLAKAFPNIEVHAFEPNPHAITRLYRNLSLNNVNNIHVHEAGVGASSGMMKLYAYKGKDMGLSSFLEHFRPTEESEEISVKVVTLDDVLVNPSYKIGLIKIDVQGFEQDVLRGAEKLIDTHRPFIFFEHEDINFKDPTQALSAKRYLQTFFAEKHYQVFYVTRYDPEMLFPVLWDHPLNGNLLAIPAAQ